MNFPRQKVCVALALGLMSLTIYQHRMRPLISMFQWLEGNLLLCVPTPIVLSVVEICLKKMLVGGRFVTLYQCREGLNGEWFHSLTTIIKAITPALCCDTLWRAAVPVYEAPIAFDIDAFAGPTPRCLFVAI